MRTTTLVMLGLCLPALTLQARCQEVGFRVALATDAPRIWPSQTASVGLSIQYSNNFNEPLRWLVPRGPGDLGQEIFAENTEGQRFRLSGSTAQAFYNSDEITDVLPAGGSATLTWVAGSATLLAGDSPAVDSDGQPVMQGELPVGEYDLWVETQEGAPVQETYPERSPDPDLYVSPRVHLSVVPEGTALVGGPRRRRGGAKQNRLLTLGGVGLARTQALRAYGVRAVPGHQGLILARGAHRVSLPYLAPGQPRNAAKSQPKVATAALPLRGTDGFYVPVRRVAAGLGLRLQWDPKRRICDLQPMPEPRRSVEHATTEGPSAPVPNAAAS